MPVLGRGAKKTGVIRRSGITLVRQGVVKAAIIRPPSGFTGSESRDIANATMLQTKLRDITGATLPIHRETSVAATVNGTNVTTTLGYDFYILFAAGATAAALGYTTAGLSIGGVRIATVGNCLILFGLDTDAVEAIDLSANRYAILKFLEDYLGYRYLWPGTSGEVLPVTATVTVPRGIDVTYNPPLKQRGIRMHTETSSSVATLGYTMADYTTATASPEGTGTAIELWYTRQPLGGTLYEGGAHGFTTYIDDHNVAHPAWFAIQDLATGSRDQTAASMRSRGRLCKANRELIDHIIAERIAILNADPSATITIGSNDGGDPIWCMCTATLATPGYPSTAGCKSLDPDPTSRLMNYRGDMAGLTSFDYAPMSDRQLWFWGQIVAGVRAVHPGATFLASTYSYSGPAPQRPGQLQGNFVLLMASALSITNEPGRQLARQDWDGWLARAPEPPLTLEMYLRPNTLHSAKKSAALLNVGRKLAGDISYLNARKLKGTDYDAMFEHWGTQGLGIYLLAKAMWNPDLDVNATIDDYCAKAFGTAAANMRAFYDLVETICDEAALTGQGEAFVLTHYSTARNTTLQSHLTAAAAATTGKWAQRVAFVQAGFDYHKVSTEVEVMYRAYLAGTPPTNAARDELGNRRYNMLRSLFLSQPFAVNTAYVMANDNRMSSMGWVKP